MQRRGLEGGINLVRGLREELRDFDYYLSEARSMKTACKTKINMILARIPNNQNNQNQNANSNSNGYSDTAATTATVTKQHGVEKNAKYDENNKTTISVATANINKSVADVKYTTESDEIDEADVVEYPSEIDASRLKEIPNQNGYHPPLPGQRSSQEGNQTVDDDVVDNNDKTISASTKIATGDSQAIAVIQSGNKGFFTVDLWEVLLRIIGYERAANRRSVQNVIGYERAANRRSMQNASNNGSRPNVMII